MTTVMATATVTGMTAMAAATTTAAKPNRSSPEFVSPRRAWIALGCVLALSSCAPKPSSTPLGVGPLALSEQEADVAAARAAQKKAARKPTAHPASKPTAAAAPVASLDADEDDAGDDDTPAADKTGKSGSAASDAKGFNGLYSGKDLAIFRITGVPERQELDEHARLRIESTSATALRITLINSENGSDLCQLNAEVQGNSAQLESDQPCFTSEEEGAIQAQLTSGKVVLSGDRLRMDAEGTLSVTLGDEELEGDLSYSFKGDRQ
jgi:hypothetical protein